MNALANLTRELGVASSTVLGCVIVIAIIGLWMCGKDLCKSYKLERQENQNHRKYEDADRKPNRASCLNVSIFGKPNLECGLCTFKLVRIFVTIGVIPKDVVSAGSQKHLLPFIHISAFGNLFSFSVHKRKLPNDQKLSDRQETRSNDERSAS